MKCHDRLYFLYLGDTSPTKFWSIFVAVFAACGLALRAGDVNGDMALLVQVMPWWAWSLALVYVLVNRLIYLLFWRGNVFTRISTPLVSIFVWGYFFAAQFVAPDFGLGLLFLVPALQETWILSRVFWDERLLWKKK